MMCVTLPTLQRSSSAGALGVLLPGSSAVTALRPGAYALGQTVRATAQGRP